MNKVYPMTKPHVSKSCDETTIISKLALFQVVNLNKSYISHWGHCYISRPGPPVAREIIKHV